MKVEKKDLEKSQIELNVELSIEEFKPFIQKGANKVSKEVKIDGFRPGNVPYEILKQKIGEMTILEEAGRLAVNDTIGQVIKDHVKAQPVGSPKVDITKLAPDNPFGYKVVLALLPEVKVEKYKELSIKSQIAKAEAKETEKMLNDLREMRVKEVAVDRGVKDGDKVLVDIQMSIDNVPVEGGQSKDAAVIIGKDFIVSGFDKQLLGAKKQDTKEFKLPYSEDFHMKNLAGKMVDFKVIIKDIFERELPVLDDNFALGFGMKKVEDLKQNIEKSIVNQKQKEMDVATERKMLDKIIEHTKFGDIPELLIESEAHNMLHEIEHSVSNQGGKFEDYLTSINKTHDQLKLDLLPEAVKRVKASLLIREIARKEKIVVSDDELKKQLEDMKKVYKDNKEMMAQLNTEDYKVYLRNALTSQKVVDKLKDWNVK